MTQLILDTDGDAVALPESRHEKYYAKRLPLSEDVEMISGRLVRELRGNAWVVGYQYGYFTTGLKNRVIAACEKGKRTPISCAFLPPESAGALTTSRFFVTEFTYPKFFFGRAGGDRPIPMWGGFSLTLREVKPSD